MTEDQKNQIRQLRAQGLTINKIADGLGLNKDTVKTFCRRNGLNGTAIDKRPHPSGDIQTCMECGKLIDQEPQRKKRRFCSDKCRIAWFNHNRNRVISQCPCCGKTFHHNGANSYCSRQCYITYRFHRGQI